MASFSVFNFNIAHGRNKKSAVFPPSVGREEVQHNLENIAACIREHDSDIVTLQEVDECSILSGSFNQFDFLKEKLQYPYSYFAPSCEITLFGKPLFVSGNGILSRFPLENCAAYKFNVSFPTERQGFVIADAKLPDGKILSIASVHIVWIDWTRPHSRARQLEYLRDVIGSRNGSRVIAGDFNADFLGKEISLKPFVDALDLQAYREESREMDTYTSWDPYERTDWVLVSKDLAFTSYATLPDRLSDHLAVVTMLA